MSSLINFIVCIDIDMNPPFRADVDTCWIIGLIYDTTAIFHTPYSWYQARVYTAWSKTTAPFETRTRITWRHLSPWFIQTQDTLLTSLAAVVLRAQSEHGKTVSTDRLSSSGGPLNLCTLYVRQWSDVISHANRFRYDAGLHYIRVVWEREDLLDFINEFHLGTI